MDTLRADTHLHTAQDAATSVAAEPRPDDDARAQQAALEQLADRINAARSVI